MQDANQYKNGQFRQSAATNEAATVRAHSLVYLLELFAARMHGNSSADIPSSNQQANNADVTRETLSARARELGFGLRFDKQALERLQDKQFPCLIALQDGSGFLATGRRNDETLIVETGQGLTTVAQKDVLAAYSGMVLQLAPLVGTQASTSGGGAQADAGEADAGNAEGRRLAREVLNHILTHNKALLMQMGLAAGLSNLMLIVLPLFIMSIYDRIIPHFATETLWALTLGVVLTLVIDFGLRVSRASLLEAITLSVSNRYQAKLYSRLMHLKLAATPRLAGGISGAIQEFENLCRIIPQMLVAASVDLPFFLLIMGLLYYIGGAIVIAPFLGLFALGVINLYSYARSREWHAASARLGHQRANQLIETLGSIELVKATTAENQLLSKWERLTDTNAYLGYEARHKSGYAGHLTVITVQATIVLTLVIGVYEVQAGGASVGALAAASLLVGRAIGPMGAFIGLVTRSLHILRTAEAIAQVAYAPTESAGDKGHNPSPQFRGQINANGVSFGYGDGSSQVLKNLEFSIQPGERVGLIGRIGCGKSSLLKLLPRFYEPTSGSLLIDGHDIRQYDPMQLRRHMGLMPQETTLIGGTLRDNICFGLERVDEAAFEQATEISGVRRFAAVHPQGYGMQVGPQGENLSGGERASVVLARTLMRAPGMLLLDEPTAAMDNDLERTIVQQLGDWLQGRTLILATHRAPMLALVDRIIWLHEGKIIADGPRNEILKKLQGR